MKDMRMRATLPLGHAAIAYFTPLPPPPFLRHHAVASFDAACLISGRCHFRLMPHHYVTPAPFSD